MYLVCPVPHLNVIQAVFGPTLFLAPAAEASEDDMEYQYFTAVDPGRNTERSKTEPPTE